MSVFIADFGRTEDGLFLYRVNGDRKEIETYMEQLKHLGCEFYDETELEKAWKTHSVLLKIKFPPKIEKELERQKAIEDEKRRLSDEQREKFRGKKQ